MGAAESGWPTLMFLTKEAAGLATEGAAVGAARDVCPPRADLVKRYEAAGGRYCMCPICFNTRVLGPSSLISEPEIQGTGLLLAVTALPPGRHHQAACQLMASTWITVSELSTKLMGRRPALTWVPHLKMIVPPFGRLVAPVSE